MDILAFHFFVAFDDKARHNFIGRSGFFIIDLQTWLHWN